MPRLRLVTFNIAHGRGLTPIQGQTSNRNLRSNLRRIAALLDRHVREHDLGTVEQQAKTGALKAREVDLAMDKTAEDRLKALGYMQAPVVVTDQDHWSGFRPDKIEELAQASAVAVA